MRSNVGRKAIQSDPEFDLMWFMQDGARPHRSAAVFAVLEEHFRHRVIALGYPQATGMVINWPPYSPDLNPCDLKDRVYTKDPQTIADVKFKL